MTNHPNRQTQRVTLVNCFSGAILSEDIGRREARALVRKQRHWQDWQSAYDDIDAAFADDDGSRLFALLRT